LIRSGHCGTLTKPSLPPGESENTPAKRRNRRAKPVQRVRQRHKSAVTFVKQSYCNIFYRKKQVFMQWTQKSATRQQSRTAAFQFNLAHPA